MEESISKLLHSQRQESQQLRREEKVRMEKERLMTETDPDKLRKLEVCHFNTTSICCLAEFWNIYVLGCAGEAR